MNFCRRKLLGPSQRHDFFDPDNPEGLKLRRELAQTALDDMLKALRQGADIGIFDATNTTKPVRTLPRFHCVRTVLRLLCFVVVDGSAGSGCEASCRRAKEAA